ncbi:MAG: DUF3800 domain-containing protein [Candidatus Moraniibacteriota bacterium]|nr:MAG: DUF3800 domain-containing protein [Candidatus Moranbacteria bacterium]
MTQEQKKLYLYADESGQDTHGKFFVVSAFVTEKERSQLESFLFDIEKKSGKKNSKWNGSKYEFRQIYIEQLLEWKMARYSLFFGVFKDTVQYIDLTSLLCAKAILKKSKGKPYKATLFIDGFKKKEVDIFKKGLRDLHIHARKIRGVKKDENNAFIRLVDAMCGLIRDAEEGDVWALSIVKKLLTKNILSRL